MNNLSVILKPKTPADIIDSIAEMSIYERSAMIKGFLEDLSWNFGDKKCFLKAYIISTNFDNTIHNNKIFETACSANNREIVNTILDKAEFDPSYGNNTGLRMAFAASSNRVIDCLLSHEKVKSLVNENMIRELLDSINLNDIPLYYDDKFLKKFFK